MGLAELGYAVALSTNGTTAIAGGTEDASETGAAWVFAPATQKRRGVGR